MRWLLRPSTPTPTVPYGGYNYPMPSYNRNVFSFGVNYSF